MAVEFDVGETQDKPLFNRRDVGSFGDFGTSSSNIGLSIPKSAESRIEAAGGFDLESTIKDVSSEPVLFENRQSINREQAAAKKGAATGASFGLNIGSAATGETDFFSGTTAVQVLGGIGTGFAVGGPWGALAGGLAAGLGSFLNTRGTKRAEKNQRAKEERYQKAVKQQIAREDKFRRQERFDNLEQVGFDRRKDKLQNINASYKDFSSQIMSAINNDATLKSRFAREGF